MGGFGGVPHTRKRSSSENSGGSVVGLDVRVQSPEALFHNKMTMMAHHNHHHRPLSSPFDNDSCAGDGDGPTAYMSFTNHINLVSGASVLAPAIDGGCGAPAPVRTLQPFDISPYTSPTTTSSTFKPSAGGMAASLGFPFTSAQWRELERQAMIYKYMMASVPVPPDLLIPTSLTPSSRSACMDGGFNLRLASGTDPEPGRCRRTDGKKWRCSRDVAPNHKYCERHMHRGRPRSRKPVEVNTKTATPTCINNNTHQIKRPRHECNPFPPIPDVTVAISNPTSRKHGPSPHFLGSSTTLPYLESPLSLANFGYKAAHFDSMPSVSANKEPRGLEWMLNGDPISLGASDSEWQSLMHHKVGLSSEGSCNNPHPHYLNSFTLYNTGMDQQNRRHPLFLNPLVVPVENLQPEKPRGFIDAWSNTETGENNAPTNNKNSAASIGKLSLSSLDLSMGGGAVNEDVGNVNIGLGLMESIANTHTDTKISLSNWLNPAPWVASTLGGPLAEVLRSSTVTATTTNEATSNTPSPATTHVESNSPLGTMVSSPSGVLQKTLVSLSDSSSNSSPRVASSRANSEMALLRFQPNVN
ncbi:growth-regulating factor 2 isoform X1 [Vigna unguiculata]|uniref:growth-regulating factor 2 isoform X1 n=1 Tax=Vigna unguiculata TaxID=3917 RepID=UPI001015E206|nr:growth-regulating factor 2 isoform X1 [Vigna unguiculata]